MVGDAVLRKASPPGGRRSRNGRWSLPIRSIRSACSGSCQSACPRIAFSPAIPDRWLNWYARDIRMRRGMMGSLSGGLASPGAATPYAMAAKMAFPDRVVIAFIGDGAMQMNGLNVMITISKYWKEWSNPRLIVMVLNNRDLNQVTWEERIQLGEGKTESTQSIPDFPYHKYAELLGLKGIFVSDPEKL